MSTTNHTPTPWVMDTNIHGDHRIRQVAGITIVQWEGFDDEAGPDVAFIVRAVNAHEALVSALEAQNASGDPDGFCGCPLGDVHAPDNKHSTQCQMARAALKLARGEA